MSAFMDQRGKFPMPRKVRDRVKEQANKRMRRAQAMVPDTERRAPASSKRRCAEDGCSVVLSIYNAGTYCHVHQRMRVIDGTITVVVSDYAD